jgi:hypothetical protein
MAQSVTRMPLTVCIATLTDTWVLHVFVQRRSYWVESKEDLGVEVISHVTFN